MAAKAPRYADDAQAERLAAAWADTCAAEYATTYHGLVRLSDGAVLAPTPIPDVAGTIVRDRYGDAWQRTFYGWDRIGDAIGAELAEVESAYGPLTVLWTIGEGTP